MREGARQKFKSAESLLRSDYCGDAAQRHPLSSSIDNILKKPSLPRELSSMLLRLQERAGFLEEVLQVGRCFELHSSIIILSGPGEPQWSPCPAPPAIISSQDSGEAGPTKTRLTGMFLRIHNLNRHLLTVKPLAWLVVGLLVRIVVGQGGEGGNY